MERARAAGVQHVRVLEARIEKQRALLQQAEATGINPAEHIERLKLLQLALEEMVIHVGQLIPSAREIAHASKTALLPVRRRKQNNV